jgi:hypothetical protein
MGLKGRFRDALVKQARRGSRGFPVATVAYYGPDDKRASKVAVGIVLSDGAEPAELERWHSVEKDARHDSDLGSIQRSGRPGGRRGRVMPSSLSLRTVRAQERS